LPQECQEKQHPAALTSFDRALGSDSAFQTLGTPIARISNDTNQSPITEHHMTIAAVDGIQ
jgi:hypothetical protein